jgi:hypothetical protein
MQMRLRKVQCTISAFALIVSFPSVKPLRAQSPAFEMGLTGPEEVVFPSGSWGLTHTPDEAISFLRQGNDLKVWFACLIGTCMARGTDFEHLVPTPLVAGKATPVLSPSGTGFDRDYAGAETVMRAANGTDLLMFYHAEVHACPSWLQFWASIGSARSTDGGLTWVRQGQVISSRTPASQFDCTTAWGAQNPSVIPSPDGRYLYMYYQDPIKNGEGLIQLARATIESDGKPGSWFKYNNGTFSEPGLGGKSTGIGPWSPEFSCTWQPSVSFNRYLNRYLMTCLGGDYMWNVITSADGITWERGQKHILPCLFPGAASLKDGDPWCMYPTIITPTETSQLTTGQSGYIYYAHGFSGWTPPHYMVRRPFIIATGPLTASITGRTPRDSLPMGELVAKQDSAAVNLIGIGMSNATWTATHGASKWMTLTSASGTGAVTQVRWAKNPVGLAAGRYIDTITVVASGVQGSPLRIVDTLTVYEPVVAADCAAKDLLGTSCLDGVAKRYLDAIGNKDSTFNLGDLLALLERKNLHLSVGVMTQLMTAPVRPSAPKVRPGQTPPLKPRG